MKFVMKSNLWPRLFEFDIQSPKPWSPLKHVIIKPIPASELTIDDVENNNQQEGLYHGNTGPC